MRSRLSALIAVVAFAAVTVAAGCGSSNNDTNSTGTTAAGASDRDAWHQRRDGPSDRQRGGRRRFKQSGHALDRLDATYRARRVLRAERQQTVIGVDADISKALGQIMGLTANVQNTPFDSIMPGLTAGKYDLGISSFTDTLDREKTDRLRHLCDRRHDVLRHAAVAADVSRRSLADLCGHSVAAEKGTTQEDGRSAGPECTQRAGSTSRSIRTRTAQPGDLERTRGRSAWPTPPFRPTSSSSPTASSSSARPTELRPTGSR